MIKEKIGYSYNDLTIIPSIISEVSSRSECNPFVKDNFLPIFTAPMASVVDENNLGNFIDNGIIPILPRNISIDKRIYQMKENHTWVALSLKEFEHYFIDEADNIGGDFRTEYFICVDIANGHMSSLYTKCLEAKKLAKKLGYKLTIMTGNIANPETYKWICNFNRLCKASIIDYIRVGIGGGSGCITTSNVSCHYPQASLIDECYNIKQDLKTLKDHLGEKLYDPKYFPNIVADGGIRNYDHVIKALALGADYVMIGSLFGQCIESAGAKYTMNSNKTIDTYKCFNYNLWKPDSLKINSRNEWHGNEVNDEFNRNNYIGELHVKFFGMASADGQKSISGKKMKTAEGITKWLPVKYTLKGWVENMVSYLRSAMSYCDCFKLEEFIGKPTLIVNSISEIQAVNK